MSSIFDVVKMAPDDPILGLNEAFGQDPRKEKVNLSIGVYCTEEGKVPLLNVVAQTEKKILDEGAPHTYLPMSGIPTFNSGVQTLIFGKGSPIIAEKRAVTVQTLGGTGALRLGAELLAVALKNPEAVVSDPTWGNHIAIFSKPGIKVGKYPYYDKATGGLNIKAMLDGLSKLKKDTIVILHACCHNPTGFDPTVEQWEKIVKVCKTKGLIPFLDIAYQGFGTGIEEDAAAIRMFAKAGIPFFVASSFSKSFSLYGERIGALTIVCNSKEEAARVLSLVKTLIRANYSNPPIHGAKIVATVLNDPKLLAQWHKDLAEMRVRVKKMRKALVEALKKQGATRDFSFIEAQNGMFSFSGLNPDQVQRLKDEFGVYAVKSGRICVAALTTKNVNYAAKAIKEVL